MPNAPEFLPHSSHWGASPRAGMRGGWMCGLYPGDPDPSPLLGNLEASLRNPARIARPMVRRGWLERGPGPDAARGRDEFIPMEWGSRARPARRVELGAREGGAWSGRRLRRFPRMVQRRAFPPCVEARCIASSTPRSAAMCAR